MASYLVELDPQGQLTGYRRPHRYKRGSDRRTPVRRPLGGPRAITPAVPYTGKEARSA
ncbi:MULTISPECIES: gas vesicle protein GvpO [unclassified Streptomyces]|uniref:gas vesicle protein GvpO n=1 Tax=unclassified Streptomyces TaxID=2593676 RepID=UPI00341C7D51